ncbi:MAG: hypothetical protein GY885_02110 [Phycisphaeraceae bacterium]|nr:hypothetical protein [Phycisphaeraceae bacterium]
MKSMLESGNYRVPDDEFQSTLQGFVQMIDRVAGPAEQNSGGYQTPHAKPAGGGGDVADMVVGQVEDKGKYCRVSVASNGERSQWVSAWDKAADAVRGMPPNTKIKGVLQPSKDGRFVNLKDVQVVAAPMDIPF